MGTGSVLEVLRFSDFLMIALSDLEEDLYYFMIKILSVRLKLFWYSMHSNFLFITMCLGTVGNVIHLKLVGRGARLPG